jgi:hypothetical protein
VAVNRKKTGERKDRAREKTGEEKRQGKSKERVVYVYVYARQYFNWRGYTVDGLSYMYSVCTVCD